MRVDLPLSGSHTSAHSTESTKGQTRYGPQPVPPCSQLPLSLSNHIDYRHSDLEAHRPRRTTVSIGQPSTNLSLLLHPPRLTPPPKRTHTLLRTMRLMATPHGLRKRASAPTPSLKPAPLGVPGGAPSGTCQGSVLS